MAIKKFYGKTYHDLIPKIGDHFSQGSRIPKALPAVPKPEILVSSITDEPDTDEMIGLTDLRKEAKHPTGKGFCAVVIDTGVAEHKFLSHALVYRGTINADRSDIDDKYGHGTHMAGIIAANGAKISGMGIAPEAKIISLKITRESSGESTWANIYKALDEVVKMAKANVNTTTTNIFKEDTKGESKSEFKVSVINLSFNGLDHLVASKNNSYHLIIKKIKQLEEYKIPVVISSGNDFEDNFLNGLGYPACGGTAIHAGATVNFPFGNEKQISTFSQRLFSDNSISTPNPIVIEEANNFLHAPGAISISCSIEKDAKKQFSYLSGTSISAAVVTGAILLLQEAGHNRFPNGIPVHLIRRALMEGSQVFINGRNPGFSSARTENVRHRANQMEYVDDKKYCCLNIPGAISKLLTY